ncbi:MAG: ABC transporter ATP-binding protein [Mycoplasmatales bacterium]|nr:ABC transporter ATP-binding protein [Mycoplasmatales bacterium]
MKKILKINELKNTIKKQEILKNITFSIQEGSFHGFIGENGAGKTTTMCFIASILNDYSGEIFFKDKLITEQEEKSILFIPERVSFPGHFTAFQFVDVFSSIFLGKKADVGKINYLFNEFEISDIKNRKANKLSSGQKKKISLIRAIVSKPKLLLIDEPAANLDPTSRLKLFNSLKQLNQGGTTIMISSHIISELENYVDSATLIKKGEVIWTGELKNEKLSKKYEEIIIKGGIVNV